MKRSKFNLSYTNLFSADMGELIPIGLQEVLPGDTVQAATSMLLRCSPLLAPVMHPVDVRIHHWYCPMRLLWDDWEDFITGGPDGMDANTVPKTASFTPTVGTLADYLGLPLGTALTPNALPFRMYNLIWNQYYRDQDLQTEQVVSLADGPDSTTNRNLLNCGWEKDYFTAARPWEQKGPTITIPIGTSAPVTISGTNTHGLIRNATTGNVMSPGSNRTLQVTATTGRFNAVTDGDAFYDPNGTLEADLSTATPLSITDLRQALALQRYEENKARWGSRYDEVLRHSFGVRPLDARLQLPEYLGGGRQTIQFSEVLQTAEGTNPVGELRGHGIAALRSNRYRRFVEEHGYVMTLFSVRPKTIYMQGIPKLWLRENKEDFWTPELQAIGQQEVLNKEVYAAHGTPDGVFGFNNRYEEYRDEWSRVAGEFRTSTLNHWHLARDFSSAPALNATFVSCVPTERVFAVPSEDVLWCQARHSVVARRLVAKNAKSYIY